MTTWLRVATVVVLALLGAALYLAAKRSGPGKSVDTYLGHLSDLRRRLLWSLAALAVGTLFPFSVRIEDGVRPALQDNLAGQTFSYGARVWVPEGVTLVVTGPMEALAAELKVSVAYGMLLAMPVFLVQAGRFLAPALRPMERRIAAWTVLPATLLFLCGLLFGALIVSPLILEGLYGYVGPIGAAPLLRVAELTSFVTLMSIIFGVAFQTPLVMAVLARLGVVSAATYAKKWRHALVVAVILMALATDGTPITLVLVTAPLVLLYAAGIGLARLVGPSRVSR